MLVMIRASLISSVSSVSMVAPSRKIVIWSATFLTSFSLWEIRIEVIPCCLNSSKSASSASLSFSFRLAVGSSRIRSFTSLESALAISISCCFPTPRLVIRVSGFSLRPTFWRSAWVRFSA